MTLKQIKLADRIAAGVWWGTLLIFALTKGGAWPWLGLASLLWITVGAVRSHCASKAEREKQDGSV